MEASSDSKLEIGGYTDHQRFNGERHMARIFLDGGEGVGKVWVGFGVVLIFIGIFWDFSENSFPCVSPGCAYYFLHGTVAGTHSDVGL